MHPRWQRPPGVLGRQGAQASRGVDGSRSHQEARQLQLVAQPRVRHVGLRLGQQTARHVGLPMTIAHLARTNSALPRAWPV